MITAHRITLGFIVSRGSSEEIIVDVDNAFTDAQGNSFTDKDGNVFTQGD